MRILITGAAGYLGCILCERLMQAGHDVTAVDLLERGGVGLRHLCANPKFKFVLCDVRELTGADYKNHDCLIPLAGVVGQSACDRRPTDATAINYCAVRWMVQLKSKHQLLFYPMTNSGYGATKDKQLCDENTPLEPVSLYGGSKKQAEDEVLQYANVVSLRLATVFGMSPNMRWNLLVNDFVRRLVNDRYLVVFQGWMRRNFVHVRDVADCFAWIIDGVSGQQHLKHNVYNLGNDALNMTKAQLAHKLSILIPETYVHNAEVATDPDKRDYNVSSKRLADEGFSAKRGLEEGSAELVKGAQLG